MNLLKILMISWKQQRKDWNNAREITKVVQEDNFQKEGMALIQQWNNLSMLRHMKRIEEKVDRLLESMVSSE